MYVLSLFDGISCGRLALDRAGIKYDSYYASEIDPNAIKVTQQNYPDTTQLGDVRNVNPYDLPKIDLLIGGSPCQGFSVSGKGLNFKDPRSRLFFEYIRIKNTLQPRYFLLENVKMKKEWRDIISDYMQVNPILVNSNIVSAQNRPRLYWTNLPIHLNEKNTELQSILQRRSEIDNYESYKISQKDLDSISPNINLDDIFCLTETRTAEAKLIRRESMKKDKRDFCPRRAKELVARTDGKSNCLTATIGKEHFVFDGNIIRYMTPIEWARLQTIPDDYLKGVTNSQAYKLIGNAWTVDVISGFFSSIDV